MSQKDNSSPSAAANDENSPLGMLKTLLLGPEQATIDRIERELHSPKAQTEKVADSLAGSLNKAYRENPGRLTQALDRPVVDCIKGSVRRDPGFFADALYPVMGPAIRRSITQALRDLVQQINQTLEHSLTLKGLKWRLEAARTGKPFAEVVLRHTLRYRVEEVFLIQTGSGLLIQHLSQENEGVRDADAVSAMLTAIRDFARDTLDREGEKGSRLETVDVGDHTLWLVHGPRAYLACAIRGVPPVHLRDEFAEVVEALHRDHAELLSAFDGDQTQAAVVQPLLEPCLKTEVEQPERRRFPWPFALLALALTGLLAWWAYAEWQDSRATRALQERRLNAVQQLSATPGILVTNWQHRDGRLQIEGLRDPLAESPATILAAQGMQAGDYRLKMRPYQSPEPSTAYQRAVQRLQPPATVQLSLDDTGTLSASGSAGEDWLSRATLLATTVPGIERFDTSGLQHEDERLRLQLLERLQPPETVTVTVRNARAALSGAAPLAWIRSVPQRVSGVEGLRETDSGSLQATEALRLNELRELIEQVQMRFVGGDAELDEGQRRRLADFAALAEEAQQHGHALGYALRLQVIGRTDGTGTPEQNYLIANRRALSVAAILRDSDRQMPEIETEIITQASSRPEPDAALRRAEFRLLGIPGPEGGPRP